jgi:hypothetical protein
MTEFQVTPEILSGIAGALLSLAFSYIPGLNTLFAGLQAEIKRLIMAGLLLLASAAIFGLGCWGIIQSGISCDQKGLVQLVTIFITSIVANQGVYGLTVQTNAVKKVLGK